MLTLLKQAGMEGMCFWGVCKDQRIFSARGLGAEGCILDVGWGCSTWDAVQCRSMRVMYVLSDELPMHTGWLQAGFPWKLWKHPGGLPALAWSACPEKRGLITSLRYLTDVRWRGIVR